MTWKQRLLPIGKRLAIVAAVLIIVFFVMDDVVMPRYVQQGETTTVPNVVGMNVEEALKILTDAGLDGKQAEVRQDKQYPVGSVAQQTPLPGAEVKFGRGVYLTVSGGEALVSVPGLRGRSVRDAELALERFGLKMGEIQYQVSTDFPENTIIDQSIAEGTKVKSGTALSVVASQGPSADKVPVPNLVKKSRADAERILLQAGLKLGNVTYQINNDLLPNTVIDQFPRFGGFAAARSSVDIFVTQRADKKTTLEY